MIKQEDLDTTIAVLKQIEIEATKFLGDVHEADPKKVIGWEQVLVPELYKVGKTKAHFKADYPWCDGDCEEYSIPLIFFVDEDQRTAYIKDVKDKYNERMEIRNQELLEVIKKREEEEKEMYKQLKAKYEAPGQC